MAEEESFKFACPHCEQPLEADCDMIGMAFDCPTCGQTITVPTIGGVTDEDKITRECRDASDPCAMSDDKKETAHHPSPVITVIKKHESFIDRCKSRMKAIGMGLGVLLLFVGVGVINIIKEGADEDMAHAKVVAASIECLLNYVEMPTERRLKVLSKSLMSCPEDFQDAVKGFLISANRTSDDMIPASEREGMAAGRAFLGLLFGAASENDPQSGVAAGLQLGDLICAGAREKANRQLKQEIEAKLNHLIDVAQKYGVDPNHLENALLGGLR